MKTISLPKTFLPTKTAELSASKWNLFVIGTGGTGSHLVANLARLLSYPNLASQRVESVTLIDGDLVEIKNVGRQLFVKSDVGKNKAAVLAKRYNAAFGLTIRSMGEMFDTSFIGRKGTPIPIGNLREPTMIIGAVDNYRARKAIFRAAKKFRGDRKAIYWLDCGNAYATGQIAWGNTHLKSQYRETSDVNFFEYLPYPAVIFPELLKPDEKPLLNCDDAIEAEEQGPNINAQMGVLAVEMIRQILIGQMQTAYLAVDFEYLNISSQPVTAAWLEQVCQNRG